MEAFDSAQADMNWKKWWLKEEGSEQHLVHFIGKDNIVFHCIIFPSMLKLFGDYILPDNVPANEFLNLEGNKLSTSKNWAVWLHEYLQEFPGREDELRYTLIANMPENKDSEFTWQDFQNRVNSELGNNLGNNNSNKNKVEKIFLEQECGLKRIMITLLVLSNLYDVII